ncbi:FAD-dependent oxidoreductase [Vibrio sp. SCSIO 43136]|uniref:NAD(P)/FAD-dependent oxidoreductase n=1 Tax=Vibrio sp. SCSIO 43136 TaxID=2819101 RepID=UPI0020755A48|nr:FAD-dependent oxidoreductase [Vibrio sp. SCSIO 43136]USD64368.1 FAD-dependent oxidoreductase [Vibrio sp. SCSIO 43136]
MKIAIIGTGISGLTSAYYLHKDHEITLFEANDYIGGHTATVEVELSQGRFKVDTGFIVYNDRTYPRFNRLLDEIGVDGVETEMSFSVRNDQTGLEYNGHTVSTLFAQSKNWVNPKFYYLIWEILRFNRLSKQALDTGTSNTQTLGEFLTANKFSDAFCQNYILPMGAAIWSSTIADMRAFPLQFFMQFFLNHGLLDVTNRPQWYVIKGGSNAYIPKLIAGFKDKIRLNTPVLRVQRHLQSIELETHQGIEQYDQVIFACHSDQALAIIEQPLAQEQQVLSALEYQANQVILHTDASLLPRNQKAWAAWNYKIDQSEQSKPTLTYDMNILQHLTCEETVCVSLNSEDQIDPAKILRTFTYHHPVFTKETMDAQSKYDLINGFDRIWFCGAYWFNGFHEDGVRSGLSVVNGLEKMTQEMERGVA